MKILSIIDSFKGTITSLRLGELVKEEQEKKGNEVKSIAIADGGDGFLDAISQNIPLDKVYINVCDPLFRKVESYYMLSKDKKTAYIELAKASGINMLTEEELNPFITSTYGFGEMIYDAVKKNVENIVIGIGGSATNDCGSGMLEALGAKFNEGKLTRMNNEKLSLVESLDLSLVKELCKNINVTVLSDVTNPLLGANGATYVFSKQKGSTEKTMPILENNIKHFASFKDEYINYPGSGAAGGVGFSLKTFLNAKMVSGIDYLLDVINYDNLYKDYDLIITGEGKIDSQSMQGKVISSIIKRTKDRKIILVCAINEIKDSKYEILSIVNDKVTKEMSMSDPETYFRMMIRKI